MKTFRKNPKYPFIRRALAKKYDKTALAVILDKAEAHYNALAVTRGAIIDLCRTCNRMMRVLLRLPGMKGLFMRLLPKMALSMFGRECGFDYTGYHTDKTRLEMDMTVCPYCKYARLLGVEPLMPTFCESDFATYGGLPGIRFERTTTLGTGGDKCDFRFIRE